MLIIVLKLNILLLAALCIFAFVVGFLIRNKQLREHRHKILELEKEMLSNHAQILELEREKGILLREIMDRESTVNRQS